MGPIAMRGKSSNIHDTASPRGRSSDCTCAPGALALASRRAALAPHESNENQEANVSCINFDENDFDSDRSETINKDSTAGVGRARRGDMDGEGARRARRACRAPIHSRAVSPPTRFEVFDLKFARSDKKTQPTKTTSALAGRAWHIAPVCTHHNALEKHITHRNANL